MEYKKLPTPKQIIEKLKKITPPATRVTPEGLQIRSNSGAWISYEIYATVSQKIANNVNQN